VEHYLYVVTLRDGIHAATITAIASAPTAQLLVSSLIFTRELSKGNYLDLQ
jgi:hypothetical protein